MGGGYTSCGLCNKNRDELIRKESRSGGVFPAIANWIISKNGVVYGCVTDSDFRAVHIRVDSNSNVHRFSGSKYVQSDLGHVCGEVQSDLLNDKYVLFSGTSCQIAGLKAFLHKANCDVSKLYTVDIVCHGVPSPRIWKDYIRYIEETYKSNYSMRTLGIKGTLAGQIM